MFGAAGGGVERDEGMGRTGNENTERLRADSEEVQDRRLEEKRK